MLIYLFILPVYNPYSWLLSLELQSAIWGVGGGGVSSVPCVTCDEENLRFIFLETCF